MKITNKMKSTLPQVGLLLAFWLFGELLAYGLKISIPGSIIGMIFLTVFMELRWVKVHQVEDVSDFLIRNMAFFFIPPGVGLMVNLDLIADNWVAISVACVLSTVLVLITTAFVAQIGQKK